MTSLRASDRMKLSAQLGVLSGELSRNIMTLIATYEAVAANLSRQGCLDGSPILSMKDPLESISQAFLETFPEPMSRKKLESYIDGVLVASSLLPSQTERRPKTSTDLSRSMEAEEEARWSELRL